MGIHGTNAERLVVANHKCTKKENSKWEGQLVTPRSLPNVCIWLEPWVVTKSSALSVSITEILSGLVKVSLKPPELLMLFTTLQVTNWPYQNFGERCYRCFGRFSIQIFL